MATNKELVAKLMGAEKYILACAHLIALPGSPAYDREGGMKKIIDQAPRYEDPAGKWGNIRSFCQ